MSTEKTEPPTPERLAELRKRGDVPVGREILRVATIPGLLAGLLLSSSTMLDELTRPWSSLAISGRDTLLEVGLTQARAAATILCTTVALGASGGLIAGISQTGGLFAPRRLLPDAKRFHGLGTLLQRWKRDSLEQACLSLAVLAVSCGLVLGALQLSLEALSELDTGVLAEHALATGSFAAPIAWLLLALLLLSPAHAAADLLLQKRQFTRRHRMSRKDIRDEIKRSEGDPDMRARRDAMRQELLDSEIAVALDDAAVIVRNPTHIAVALQWEPGSGTAPRVLVSGRGARARYILRHARRRGVPEIVHRPVARSLVQLPAGALVPERWYGPVAEVLRWAIAETKRH